MDDGVTYADEIARLRRERRQRAWQLHRDGLSYRKIGQLLGISHVQVGTDVDQEQQRRDDALAGKPEPEPEHWSDRPRPMAKTAGHAERAQPTDVAMLDAMTGHTADIQAGTDAVRKPKHFGLLEALSGEDTLE